DSRSERSGIAVRHQPEHPPLPDAEARGFGQGSPPVTMLTALDRLRGVTRGLASTDNLESVLQSITDAMVAHADAAKSRLHLILTDDECPECRTSLDRGRITPRVKALHLVGESGPIDDGPSQHRIELDSTLPVANVVRGGVPVLIQDWQRNQTINR